MKKLVFIPDSFKGTLSSRKICDILEECANQHFPDAVKVSIPVADGGEGSVDCFLAALSGELVKVNCKNPYFEDMEGFYGIIENGRTAVIEMAACAGLPLVESRKNPSLTTTYGVGMLMLDAMNRGCRKIIMGLGGSCTNDFGCGAAAALGIRFRDRNGKEFVPVGGTLCEVFEIDMTGRNKLIEDTEIITMCDIDNPVCGERGAAFVFAPQKGANEKMVKSLDDGLLHISRIVEENLGENILSMAGGGAAGGMGAGMRTFFDSDLQMGIDTVLDTVNFDDIISDADVIFTGEGKIDSQSLRGKVVIGVAKRAKKKNVPVIVLAGGAGADIEEAYKLGVTAVFTINRMPEDFSVSRFKSEENLQLTADNVFRLLRLKG